MVIGLGLIFLGVPPGGEEIARSLAFLVIAVFYAGVWLALAMLLSIVFRSPATAALVALGIWLFLTVLWPMLAPAIAQVIAPPDPRYAMLGLEYAGHRGLGADAFAHLAEPSVRRGDAGACCRRRRERSDRCFSNSCAAP